MSDPDETAERLLARACEQLRIMEGLATALSDPVRLATIAASAEDPDAAVRALQAELGLDDLQARAAVDAQVRRFTRRDVDRIGAERDRLREVVSELERTAE